MDYKDALVEAKELLDRELAEKDYRDARVLTDVGFPYRSAENEVLFNVVYDDGDYAHVLEVTTSTSNLNDQFRNAAKDLECLSRNGHSQVETDIMVFDEAVKEVQKAEDNLGIIFSEKRLREDSDLDQREIEKLYHTNIINDLCDFEGGFEPREDLKFPVHDYEGLEEKGYLEESEGVYVPTSKLDSLFLMDDLSYLHFTPRMESVHHPDYFQL